MILFRLITPVLVFIALALPARADFETRAEAAWVYDTTTETVLLDKQADVSLPPASMSKLMTLNMLFEALRDGRVDMDTRFGVSSEARAMGGSTMFLNERDRPTVEELIQGIIVMSGNDACVVVAEGLAGSEDAFARQMNERAADLGMDNSNFTNASGWPDPDHRMSMHDLGILSARLIEEFPEYYGYFAQEEFRYDDRAPQNRFNRNPLLGLGLGADGLKTGHTTEAGYGLAASATQGDRRIVFVLSGLDSATARREESERVINWAFRQFVERRVLGAGERVTTADVWLGERGSLDLVAGRDVTLLIPAMAQGNFDAQAHFVSPLEAPIAQGDEVGTLVISVEGLPDTDVPLIADQAVARGGFVPRLQVAATALASDLLGDRLATITGAMAPAAE